MTTLTFLKKINYKKVGIGSIILLLFSILFGFVAVPKLLRSQLRKVMRERETREKKNNFQIDFRFINICFAESRLKTWKRPSGNVGKGAVCGDF